MPHHCPHQCKKGAALIRRPAHQSIQSLLRRRRRRHRVGRRCRGRHRRCIGGSHRRSRRTRVRHRAARSHRPTCRRLLERLLIEFTRRRRAARHMLLVMSRRRRSGSAGNRRRRHRGKYEIGTKRWSPCWWIPVTGQIPVVWFNAGPGSQMLYFGGGVGRGASVPTRPSPTVPAVEA